MSRDRKLVTMQTRRARTGYMFILPFIIGFVLAALCVSLLKGRSLPRFLLVTVCVGIPCIYLPGIAVYMLYVQTDLWTATVTLTSVFILIDLAKCVIASLIAVPLRKALARV